MNCPCNSETPFDTCCGPYLAGTALPDTAEKLMRSRYTAYAKADIEYVKKTMVPEARKGFDVAAAKEWAESSIWKGLKIVDTQKGGPEDKMGLVEFIATYEVKGKGIDHHEVASFKKTKDGQWLFVDGESHEHNEGEGHKHDTAPVVTVKRESPKIGRNDPCPCGSGKKYKKCCEGTAAGAAS